MRSIPFQPPGEKNLNEKFLCYRKDLNTLRQNSVDCVPEGNNILIVVEPYNSENTILLTHSISGDFKATVELEWNKSTETIIADEGMYEFGMALRKPNNVNKREWFIASEVVRSGKNELFAGMFLESHQKHNEPHDGKRIFIQLERIGNVVTASFSNSPRFWSKKNVIIDELYWDTESNSVELTLFGYSTGDLKIEAQFKNLKIEPIESR